MNKFKIAYLSVVRTSEAEMVILQKNEESDWMNYAMAKNSLLTTQLSISLYFFLNLKMYLV